jgi:cytochrome c oxidase subunit 1
MMKDKLARLDIPREEAKISLAYVYVAFAAFLIGATAGVVQGLQRAGLIELPGGISYYQILTAHGVLLALVFTTNFIFAFLYAGNSKTLGTFTPLSRKVAWGGFFVLTLGTLLSLVMILLDEATVLYTFYAPLQAHPLFYIGLALFVVGTWIAGGVLVAHYMKWKREHKGELSPLFGFMTVATILLWYICTIGVAATVILQFIPWSLGISERINILLSRTLFWYFGHPLVYFWLLPAYMAWYIVIPKLIGGRLFSDGLARLAFVLFLLFSIPVGFHHQLMETGISPSWKYIQVILTFAVVIPSLLTAFSIFATFEQSGRAKGAQGTWGWLKKLPWGDVRFFAPFLAMLIFIPAGAGGIINASYQMNAVVHNTLWVVGHFHLTVGSTVVLTFFGISYWLLPVLSGRTFTPFINRLGMIQAILWAVGMFFMSGAMHLLGLLGAPRRTAYTTYQDHPTALEWFEGIFINQVTMSIGGVILFLAALLMIFNVIYLIFLSPRGETTFPIGEVAPDAAETPRILENWKLWVGLAAILILFAYTIPLMDMIQHSPPGSPPIRPW